jgi:long-chain acyl-CoA synthetase
LISNNRLEWAVAYFATVGLGAQIVPMYEAQKESDWQYIIKDSEAKVILAASDKIYAQIEPYMNTVLLSFLLTSSLPLSGGQS